ncbi:MAG: molybdopterin-guanine dinucleotide biosynthesis protein B [Promethearchaeota archaeon]
MVAIRIFDVIGYSGSGKTYFIMNAIKLLKQKLNLNVAVIKNVKHHQIDEKGKDSRIFTEVGASYSIIQNLYKEVAVFLNTQDISFDELIKWLDQGPYKINVIFTEGFRNLNNPTILCISNIDEIKPQLSDNVKMISGIICRKRSINKMTSDIPIIDIEEDFQKFLDLFDIT